MPRTSSRVKRPHNDGQGGTGKKQKKQNALTVEVTFDFRIHSWNMELACDDISYNPAPNTTSGIYIIHNENSNNTYIGYADNANHRWEHRVETFFCLGIEKAYAKKVHCAFCYPSIRYEDGTGSKIPKAYLQGKDKAEHLLIRAVEKGLLGNTICVNSQLTKPQCNLSVRQAIVTDVLIILPSPFGRLQQISSAHLSGVY